MRRPLLALAVVALATSVTGAAHADPPVIVATTCGLATSTDPTGTIENPGTEVGIVWSLGAAADLSTDLTGNPAVIDITCDVKVGGTGSYTEVRYGASVHDSGSPAVVPVSLVLYNTTPTTPVYLCTTIAARDAHGDARTLYYDETTDSLVTNPATAKCALAIQQEVPPQQLCDAIAPVCTTGTLDFPADVRVVEPVVVVVL